MKSILVVIVLILGTLVPIMGTLGCAMFETQAGRESAARLSGIAAVEIAHRIGGVNGIELAAIRPLVQDARTLLLTESSDVRVAAAELLVRRMNALEIPPDERLMLGGILTEVFGAVREAADAAWADERANPYDIDAAEARRTTAAFLEGLDIGIGMILSNPVGGD